MFNSIFFELTIDIFPQFRINIRNFVNAVTYSVNVQPRTTGKDDDIVFFE